MSIPYLQSTALVLGLVVLTSACTTTRKDDPFTGWMKPYKDCRALYAEIDARIDAAGVRDASYYRVPGFPYLRTDRVLASFRNEAASIDEFGGWTRRMREFDQEAREFEYQNLGLSDQERGDLRYRLLTCGHGLAGIELDDPQTRSKLIKSVVPPDEYSFTSRATGIYPLSLPLLKAHVGSQHREVTAQSASPPVPASGTPQRWQAAEVEDAQLAQEGFTMAQPDELGFPGIVDSAWRALAAANAPQLLIESDANEEQPGTPRWTAGGVAVDTATPQMHYHITFTRFGTQRLAQINYFIWFRASPQRLAATPQADIDGLIWRVTLDAQAQPLIFESLHASGSDHRWFPVQDLALRQDIGFLDEPPLLPQGRLAPGPIALQIEAGSHRLRRVTTPPPADDTARQYVLQRYEELFTLARPQGDSRSLYDVHGVIPGSDAGTNGWQWISGRPQAGALRVLGHHAISSVGRQHFDDAFLLETYFEPLNAPASAGPTAPAKGAVPVSGELPAP